VFKAELEENYPIALSPWRGGTASDVPQITTASRTICF